MEEHFIRSELKSRSEVSLTRKHVFRNSKQTWEGVPLSESPCSLYAQTSCSF
jgi:hypothetical protein